jgi:hypothetical protein
VTVRPAALALCLALVTTSAGAQTAVPSDAPSGSRVDEAQHHIAAGLQRFRVRDYSAAIHEFELANAAVPTPELWFNISRAREMLLDYRGAVDDLRRYLRDKVDPPDRADVERHVVELERLDEIRRAAQARQAVGQTMRVAVEGGPATVVLDGRPQSAAAFASPVATGEGIHRVEVLRPGMQPWVALVRVRSGESAAVFSNPAASTVYRTRPAPHVASAIVGGLGLAALGVSAYFGVRAAGEDCNACDARSNAAERSDVFLGTGALLAVGAAVAFFIERASSTTVTQR